MVLSSAAADCGALPGQRGFTLVEMVTVMVIVGIMAAVVAPKFADNTLNERGFHDAVLAAIQQARRSAMASRRYQCVNIAGGAGTTAFVAVFRDVRTPEIIGSGAISSCTTQIPLAFPNHGCALPNQVCAPADVTVGGPAQLIFDPQGRLVTAPDTLALTATITISGQPSISVVPQTGYVQ